MSSLRGAKSPHRSAVEADAVLRSVLVAQLLE